ncbi:eg:bacr7a4.3 protein-related [Holotrichia oblita]|uniref:Eg:bacr7a4.3 protein-related n=1 Tax=Holotrichia oblita TaxID=644536 RepID=A0ACB9SZN0_HOLOL|nr:eg:bacr7a4.3 protein-related [Holotrichia oblita]
MLIIIKHNNINIVCIAECLEYRRSQFTPIENRLKEDASEAIGGVDAKPLEFPHMAILGYGNSNGTKWLCGGSLISENFVLTAAHCIYSQYGNVTIVKLGLHQISQINVFIQIFTVKNVYLHPKYNPLENYHDIALIELDHSANINSGVKPACLQTSKELPNNSFTGTGWGATELYGDFSDILQKVNLSYVPHNNCSNFYKGQKKMPKGLIDDWQVCADGGGQKADTCQGDSGGPIQLPRYDNGGDSLYTVIGITSVGIKCAIVPAIYTRISYYVPWIETLHLPECLEYKSKYNRVSSLPPSIPYMPAAPSGEDAEVFEYPHMAILGYGDFDNPTCNIVWDIGYNFSGRVAVVRLGVHKISKYSSYIQTFKVGNTYVHPEYDPLKRYHDIALIQLHRSPYIFSGVKPACLHTSKRLPKNYFTATGWGATEYADYSDTLQKVKLRHVSYNRCKRFYRRRIKLPYGLMHDRQMCADGGGTGADTCQGDSGGPIQLPRDESVAGSLYTIIGITSVGLGCSKAPSIYTRVSFYVPWIENIVWPN